MKVVCVLDMDETLGFYKKPQFIVRPYVNLFIKTLDAFDIDIILWSYGEDSYVKQVINSALGIVAKYAYKIFARKECCVSEKKYNYSKYSEHIRNLYEEDIFLIGVDDNAHKVMDPQYNILFKIQPFLEWNSDDIELIQILNKIITEYIE